MELWAIWQIFLSLSSRCFSGVKPEDVPPLEIEREIFYKYIKMSGLWAQRLYQQFKGNMKMESSKLGISFEKFLLVNCKYSMLRGTMS